MRTLQEIIDDGYNAKNKCLKHYDYITYISGPEFEEWLVYCTRYLQQNYPKDPQTRKFEQIAERASSDSVRCFEILIGILKAFKEMPTVEKSEEDIDELVSKICNNFHRCARSILNRHGDRNTIEIKDEYDVQDLLQGILRLFVDDIRPEDYVPSYAGGNSRTDFYLPKYDTYIETKMTRLGLQDKEVGEQLSVDIARYGDHCTKLICFIYDKDSLLKNPYGLIEDLEKLSSNRLKVKVYVSPL